MRRIELWMEVQELNDEGRYAAVNIEPEPEVSLKCAHLIHSLFRAGQEVWCSCDRARPDESW